MDLDMIYNEDCSVGLDRIPDGSVDLVVMDPPYQFRTSGGGCFGPAKRCYIGNLEPISKGIQNDVLEKIVGKLKAVNIYIWCNKAQIYQYLDFFVPRGCNVDLLCWHKPNPIPSACNKYLSDTEYLLFFREKGVPLHGNYDTKRKYYILPQNRRENRQYNHPTVKPLEIMRNIIINSTLPGDTVLDPYMGSGTTAVACIETGRHYLGYEIDAGHCKTAMDRISAARP